MQRAWLADGEPGAQCEELAVGGGERGLERGDLFSTAALLIGELGRELAGDVARRGAGQWGPLALGDLDRLALETSLAAAAIRARASFPTGMVPARSLDVVPRLLRRDAPLRRPNGGGVVAVALDRWRWALPRLPTTTGPA